MSRPDGFCKVSDGVDASTRFLLDLHQVHEGHLFALHSFLCLDDEEQGCLQHFLK